MQSTLQRRRRVSAWEWHKKARQFNKMRRRMAKDYRNKGNFFWAKILERIYVPCFMLEYVNDPLNMPASFYIPGYLVEGHHLRAFHCNAGDLSRLVIYLFVPVGLDEEKIPVQIRYLLRILE